MHGPDGTDYPNKSIYVEIVKPERIVYTNSGGKKGDPGAQFQATWTFEAQGDKTAHLADGFPNGCGTRSRDQSVWRHRRWPSDARTTRGALGEGLKMEVIFAG